MAISSPASSPLRFETIGRVGAWNVRDSATARNSSSIGSISGEWNAWLTGSRVVLRPCARQCASSSPIGAGRPGDDRRTRAVDRGEVDASSGSCDLVLGGLDGEHRAAVGQRLIRRPRAPTSAAASASDSTPATCAAATSPIEWPITTSGATPHDSSRRYSATSSANSAGWVYSVRSSASPSTNIRSLTAGR